MKILGTGSRDWTDEFRISRIFEMFSFGDAPPVYIEGGQRGFDKLSRKVAERLGWTVREYAMKPGEQGNQRNVRMLLAELKLGDIDIGLGFPLPQSTGTWHMIGLLRHRGIPTLVEPSYRMR